MGARYEPILATLGYVLSRDRQSVLLVDRSKRKDDIHYGKHNGLGGKLERHEDIVSGMVREIEEEAGIRALNLQLRGTINWPGFGGEGEDWFGFIFLIDEWDGVVKDECDEGFLRWVSLSELNTVNFWESDHYWLGMVFDQDLRVFHGVAPFENGRMISWSNHRI